MNRIFPRLIALTIWIACSIAAIDAKTHPSVSGMRIIEDIHNSKNLASLEQELDKHESISQGSGPVVAQAGAPPPNLIPPPPAQGTVYKSPPSGQASLSYPAALNQPNIPIGSDITSQLALKKGMRIVFLIRHGLDTRWKHVGDYSFEAHIEFNDHRGYAFDWHMSPPANASGARRVELEDIKNAHKVSLFYPDNESATLVGYTSIVRISDFHYKKLKAGQKAQFELDGPHSHLVMKKHTRPIPTTIIADGYEDISIGIDGNPTTVRTIRAKTDIGWTYWILDNPSFPLMVRGNGPFQWTSNILASGGIGSSSGNNTGSTNSGGGSNSNKKAQKEAQNVIKQLKDKGKATSYLILFDFDSDRLRPLSKEILAELSQYLNKNNSIKLRLEGHTCNIGGKDYNLKLSQRRAESVKKFLVDHCGINASRLIPIGYGLTKPVQSNSTEAGREKNRRVVFTEIKP